MTAWEDKRLMRSSSRVLSRPDARIHSFSLRVTDLREDRLRGLLRGRAEGPAGEDRERGGVATMAEAEDGTEEWERLGDMLGDEAGEASCGCGCGCGIWRSLRTNSRGWGEVGLGERDGAGGAPPTRKRRTPFIASTTKRQRQNNARTTLSISATHHSATLVTPRHALSAWALVV